MSKIEEYLKLLEEGSRKTYRSHLNTFFKTIKSNPETYISPDKEEKDYANDIIYFLIKRKSMAPKTNNVSKSAILSFLEENDIEIGRKHRKRINKQIKGKRAITRDLPFSKKDIKLFLPHVKPHIRAVILIAISSGMRIDEILKLKNKLINRDKKPGTIYLTKDMTKNHEKRTVFISDEAKEALESYLKTKPQHIRYMKKSRLVKETLKEPYDDKLIFQFSYENVRKSLYRALKKVGLDTLDPTTDRHQKHIHSFRKYFKKQLSSTMDSNCLNQLVGHESELDKAYTPWEEPELAEEYLKNMEHITIYGSSSNYAETAEKIKTLEDTIDRLSEELGKIINPTTDDIENPAQLKIKEEYVTPNKKQFKYWSTQIHYYLPYGEPFEVTKYGFPKEHEEEKYYETQMELHKFLQRKHKKN